MASVATPRSGQRARATRQRRRPRDTRPSPWRRPGEKPSVNLAGAGTLAESGGLECASRRSCTKRLDNQRCGSCPGSVGQYEAPVGTWQGRPHLRAVRSTTGRVQHARVRTAAWSDPACGSGSTGTHQLRTARSPAGNRRCWGGERTRSSRASSSSAEVVQPAVLGAGVLLLEANLVGQRVDRRSRADGQPGRSSRLGQVPVQASQSSNSMCPGRAADPRSPGTRRPARRPARRRPPGTARDRRPVGGAAARSVGIRLGPGSAPEQDWNTTHVRPPASAVLASPWPSVQRNTF